MKKGDVVFVNAEVRFGYPYIHDGKTSVMFPKPRYNVISPQPKQDRPYTYNTKCAIIDTSVKLSGIVIGKTWKALGYLFVSENNDEQSYLQVTERLPVYIVEPVNDDIRYYKPIYVLEKDIEEPDFPF